MNKPAVRAGSATALYVVAAGIGLLSHAALVAVIALILAGSLHFWLGLRRVRRESLPRSVLLALLRDQLEEFHRSLEDCPLTPCWTVWLPSKDGSLSLCAGDSSAEHRLDSQRPQTPDRDSAVWSAYHLKNAQFESRDGQAPNPRPAGTTRQVDTRTWQWRLAYPIFHVADLHKVAGVMAVEGTGDILDPMDLDVHEIRDLCERATHVARRIVSVLETYG